VANPFYQRGVERATRVRALFATIAHRYDLINDLQSLGLHRHWKRRLVRLARVGPGQEALDVCCGTGDVAFALADTGASVVGLDFSPEMLAVAEARRVRRVGRLDDAPPGSRSTAPAVPGSVRFVEGDALQLPFPDSVFDAVTIAYGLRNLAALGAGIAELCRVLRPGGRLVALDFGKPANRAWRALYFGYLRAAVPVFGWLFAGSADAYGYILESLHHYPGQEEVAALLRRQGLSKVTTVNLLCGAMGLHAAERMRRI
jgi:demethylmenaquinone methyltransferase / 2-methoxy-6-polyprenyl-1,4-benzoquinol methylase